MTDLWYRDRFDILTAAAAEAPTDGLVLEFGVGTGSTIRWLADRLPMQDRKVYGFDSFRGLPEPWAGYKVGHFACPLPTVPANVELVIGYFAESLPPFLAAHEGDAALVHIDCDLYSSTRTVLEMLEPRIVIGTVIVMDEYWIMPEHEQRAFQEWLKVYERDCHHFCRSVEQACVVIMR
jgi:predicted O-methyltransferase YrrM